MAKGSVAVEIHLFPLAYKKEGTKQESKGSTRVSVSTIFGTHEFEVKGLFYETPDHLALVQDALNEATDVESLRKLIVEKLGTELF